MQLLKNNNSCLFEVLMRTVNPVIAGRELLFYNPLNTSWFYNTGTRDDYICRQT